MMEKKEYDIVKKGKWLYNSSVYKSIFIIKQNWDFFYEEGYDDDAPDLNENGEAFYVIMGAYHDIKYANRSQTCLSLEEAMKLAKDKILSNIEWS